MRLATLLIIMASVLLVSGCGITASSRNAGYADLDSLGFWDVDNTMSLSFGPSILRLAASGEDNSPETEALLRGLDGVRVKTYDIVGDEQKVFERIDQMRVHLEAQGWVPVIVVQEQGERTVMLMKVEGEAIVGLTVLNSDAQEAVIVNIMGELQPEMFSETMAALDVDVPGVEVVDPDLN